MKILIGLGILVILFILACICFFVIGLIYKIICSLWYRKKLIIEIEECIFEGFVGFISIAFILIIIAFAYEIGSHIK